MSPPNVGGTPSDEEDEMDDLLHTLMELKSPLGTEEDKEEPNEGNELGEGEGPERHSTSMETANGIPYSAADKSSADSTFSTSK